MKHLQIKPPYLSFVLPDVYTEEECNQFITSFEQHSFTPALINAGGGRQELNTSVRHHQRFMTDDEDVANDLWARIGDVVTREWKAYASDHPLGLNERLRVMKYEKGDYFKPHHDIMHRNGPTYSMLSVIVYLNDGFKGGETTFLDESNVKFRVPCAPVRGSVLVFDQNLYHEGSLLIEGVKYAMRTDVMFVNDT